MRDYIMKVLSFTGGNISKAARILKTDKKTIYRYLKKK
jgi:ActR/RegA family two-component response regulator